MKAIGFTFKVECCGLGSSSEDLGFGFGNVCHTPFVCSLA